MVATEAVKECYLMMARLLTVVKTGEIEGPKWSEQEIANLSEATGRLRSLYKELVAKRLDEEIYETD